MVLLLSGLPIPQNSGAQTFGPQMPRPSAGREQVVSALPPAAPGFCLLPARPALGMGAWRCSPRAAWAGQFRGSPIGRGGRGRDDDDDDTGVLPGLFPIFPSSGTPEPPPPTCPLSPPLARCDAQPARRTQVSGAGPASLSPGRARLSMRGPRGPNPALGLRRPLAAPSRRLSAPQPGRQDLLPLDPQPKTSEAQPPPSFLPAARGPRSPEPGRPPLPAPTRPGRSARSSKGPRPRRPLGSHRTTPGSLRSPCSPRSPLPGAAPGARPAQVRGRCHGQGWGAPW